MLAIFVLAAALLAAPAASAQDAEPPQDEGGTSAVRRAVPRKAAPRSVTRPDPPPPVATPETRRLERSERAGGERDQAVPRGSRSRGDNPPVGTAVPRGSEPAPSPSGAGVRTDRGRTVVVPGRSRTVVVAPPVYHNYYYYPRHHYPYGYGAFGLGYFYYDPYTWYPRSYSSHGYSSYGGSYYGRYGWDVGELRLDVSPRHAQVFVDGAYAGIVDDFDGAFQALKLEPGTYRLRIVAPGYETLEFDVRITPRQKTRYRGDLQRY